MKSENQPAKIKSPQSTNCPSSDPFAAGVKNPQRLFGPSGSREISTLVIDRNPSEFALYLTNGGPVWTIFPVTDGDENVVKKS